MIHGSILRIRPRLCHKNTNLGAKIQLFFQLHKRFFEISKFFYTQGTNKTAKGEKISKKSKFTCVCQKKVVILRRFLCVLIVART
jgi:hypothetical protein